MADLEVGRFHALLVAIENYPRSPLFGCVNDINQVGDFLVNRLGVPAASLRKMVAPADESQSAESPPELAPETAPTYAKLVAALKYLAGDSVQAGDRVFIYYCGHGSYRKMPEAEAYFEGLVPQDFAESGLLFDVELNELLQAIAERCHDLTVVLDCCHSAGATRELPSRLEDVRARFLSLPAGALDRGVASVLRSPPRMQPQTPRTQPQEYTVVAACHADETAAECRMPAKVGPPHGLFTYCLLELLSGLDPAALDTARWSDIWEPLKAAVTGQNPAQRPQLLGPKERRVFGGPWQPQDLGFAVSTNPDGSYRIAAGRLAGLGPGAQVAVYGPAPAQFPPLDSEEDKQVRLGLLTVGSVEPAQSTASVQQAPFAVPAGSRGRLIKLGAPDLLRVTLARDVDAEVGRHLIEKPGGNRFILLPETDSSAEVHVGQYPGGDLWIGDDLYGPGEPFEDTAPGPMGRIPRAGAPLVGDAQAVAIGLRAALNHYAQYVIPLRVYRQGGFTLPEQALALELLDCNDPEQTRMMLERDASQRRPVRRDDRGRYLCTQGDRVAFHVHNTLSTTDLYVFLLVCNLEGQIQLLDQDVVIRARSGKIFWSDGDPFMLGAPAGHSWGIDRLIVIATDQKGLDLDALNQKQTMNDAIRAAMGTRNILGSAAKSPVGTRWTAAQMLIQLGRPAARRPPIANDGFVHAAI